MRLQYCMDAKTSLGESDKNLLTSAGGSVIDSDVFDSSHLKEELLTEYMHMNVTDTTQRMKLNLESEKVERTISDGLNSCGCSSRESCSPEVIMEDKRRSDVHSGCSGGVCKANVSSLERYRSSSEDLDYNSALYANLSLRTLGDIRNSLEGKVKRMREEKVETSAKIEQAQIEDTVRRMEKQKLRLQLNLHRRDRLKTMIHDLHGKLENQSIRLQLCYSAILSVQRSFIRKEPTACALNK